ncbi:MAG: hypothetical protein J5I98_08105 [Phaeodactylibacter sp.]|nr:hypothetical protein [Phaeodactylibacter sp.]
MHGNKLVQALATMDKKEVRAFSKYIHALHGKHEAAMALFSYLKTAHPELDGPKLEKSYVMRNVLPQSAKNPEKRILNESSRLYKWLEEFLLREKLREKDNPAREKLLAEIFRERKLSHLFYLKAEGFLSKYDPKAPPSHWAVLDALYMQHLLYYYSDPNQSLHDKGAQDLQGLMEKSDVFFLASKLQYGCEMANRQNVLRETYSFDFRELVKNGEEQNMTAASLLHQAFFLAARLLTDKRTEDYHALKVFFTAHYDTFCPEAQQILQGYLVNFAAAQIRQKKYDFIEEVFSLYDFEMTNQIFFEQGLISSLRFINIVSVACALRKPAQAAAFVEKWRPYLRADVREETLAVARAMICFENKQFSQARGLLVSLKHQDPQLEIRIRSYLLLSMVEQHEEANFILSQCRNFEDYLRRNKVLGDKTSLAVLNFLQCLKKYITNSAGPQTLEEEVNACSEIFFRNWLLRKARGG